MTTIDPENEREWSKWSNIKGETIRTIKPSLPGRHPYVEFKIDVNDKKFIDMKKNNPNLQYIYVYPRFIITNDDGIEQISRRKVTVPKTHKGGMHLYKYLNIKGKSTRSQIKKAYEKLKKKGRLSKKVKKAYRILSNRKSRKKYHDSYKKSKRNQKGCSRKKMGGHHEALVLTGLALSRLLHGKKKTKRKRKSKKKTRKK